MNITVALAGNPNCGKTTLFNILTGSNQFVGNWPGVTVEKKEGKYTGDKKITITDLPGIYSLSPYTLEEVVARNYLVDERPDAILNLVDGTNLERNLYLTTQLLELGIPVVIAINMMDVVEKRGDKIDTEKLSEELGVPVVCISALKNKGIKEAMESVIATSKNRMCRPAFDYSDVVKDVLEEIRDRIKSKTIDSKSESELNWYSLKVFEKDEKIISKLNIEELFEKEISPIIEKYEEELDDDSESIITGERYNYIESIIQNCLKKANTKKLTTSDKIDRIVTNRFLALPIFGVVMFIVYYISVSTVGTWVTDWTNEVLFGEIIPPAVEGFLTSVHCADWLSGLILDGIIAGVGAVLGFVPQMFVLFAFLAFLESCGYMARVAFIMDRIFRKFGLSGKSFIPMLIGSGCGVPGIMASRTIENDRDRKITIMTTTFIPCGAKLPIIALIAGALFGGAWWVAPSAYFVGIVAVIISGILLKKTKMFAGDPAPFVIELPEYHLPTIGNLCRSIWERGWSFIKKAGTIILVSTVFIWFTSYFGWIDGKFVMLEDTQMNYSILSYIGRGISWLFIPLGWGDWKTAVAAVTGLVAKENVVGTFGILYGLAEVSEDGAEVWSNLQAGMTQAAAYSFLVFNLLCAPCFAAMGAIKREMNNGKWFAFAIGYQTIFAYVIALIVFQIGTLIISGIFGLGTVVAVLLIAAIVYLLLRKPVEVKRQPNRK